jgi:hypothetical protein
LTCRTREDVVEAIHTQLRKVILQFIPFFVSRISNWVINTGFLIFQLQEEMRSGQVDLDKYVITKTLTKSPESYPDAKSQPHVQVEVFSSQDLYGQSCFKHAKLTNVRVQVALRLKQSGHRVGSSIGDTVPYIICYEQVLGFLRIESGSFLFVGNYEFLWHSLAFVAY